ncbi:MAG TPA: hypothetical protein VF753_05435 [Terriglobales bacterium]
MRIQRQVTSANAFALLLAASIVFAPAVAPAANLPLAKLAGTWEFALVGNTSCGQTSLWFSGDLNGDGQANGELWSSSACGVDTVSYQAFAIANWDSRNGKATATLSCGSGCTWHFDIQTTPNEQVMNLADVYDSTAYLTGTGVKMIVAGGEKASRSVHARISPNKAKAAPAITLAQLAGTWQIALSGQTGCGLNSLLFSGTLNAKGLAYGTLFSSSGCGTGAESNQTLTITGLDADGSGSAILTCGAGCGWSLIFQLSINKQIMNFVDIEDSNNYLAGSATKLDPNGTLTLGTFLGDWQITFSGNTDCGANALEFSGSLGTNGQGDGELRSSSGCGVNIDGTQDFTVTSFNADGSGTANLSCGNGCAWNFRIQVSPNGKVFALADVSDPNNYLAGIAIQYPFSTERDDTTPPVSQE